MEALSGTDDCLQNSSLEKQVLAEPMVKIYA
jgi:hypothetical protein